VPGEGAAGGSERRDSRGSSAGAPGGDEAKNCVKDPGPGDACWGEGWGALCGAVLGCGTASFAPVIDWNIRVKSPGVDFTWLAGGCGWGSGAGGEYIGTGVVGCDSGPGVEAAGADTSPNICVKAPGAACGVAAAAGGGAGGGVSAPGCCAVELRVCRS
jgi:hypothetical protein